ncbi:FTR1 family protein [Entomomonas sp. E2T0]|uniref:FTR1 family iron permease n=1 Tax=Entomomonas sp. E2T0 TaxID=2930213 RepID=UPI0022283FCF|nr:FTR1 family protein [Entomomonas sp. E2T0]UYZ85386.1 FTR1 family protein [Entomomonas sp. E2T0]
MWQALFIVWRESVEALLVIGILYAWINHQVNAGHTKKMLWIGTGLGILFACALAVGFTVAGEWFSGTGGDWFQVIMMAVASILIFQMVIWMQKNGRAMKKNLEAEAAQSFAQRGGFGILLLAMLAVAREGSEIVIFLYSSFAAAQGTAFWLLTLGSVAGAILGYATFMLLQLSSHIISWRVFFNISAIILLLLGGALLMSALDKSSGLIIDMLANADAPEWSYTLFDPVWDSSFILSDTTTTGSFIASITGYRAQPMLLGIILIPLYWIIAIIWTQCNNRIKH